MVLSLVPTPALAEIADELGGEEVLETVVEPDDGSDDTVTEDDTLPENTVIDAAPAGDAEAPVAQPEEGRLEETNPDESQDLVLKPLSDNEPEGDVHDYAGTRFSWTDEENQLEYTCYVTSPKDGGEATAAVYYIDYVGEENLEYGSLDVTIPSTISDYTITEIGTTEYGTYDYLIFANEVGSLTIPATVTKVNRLVSDSYLREIIFDPACQVTEIPDNFVSRYYLYSDSPLTRVVLPDSVERIGEHAFRRQYNLKTVNMPASLKSIEDFAFAETNLETISLPEGLETIGTGAFTLGIYAENTATSIVIPDSVTSIGDFAFARAVNIGWDKSGSYVTGSTSSASPIESITLGSSLRHIGSYAFANSQITDLVLPATLEELGEYAFEYSTQLKTVTWSDVDQVRLTTIADGTFSYCDALRSFEMPVSVTSIGNSAFYGCEVLRDIILPPGLVSLGDNAFCNCRSLETATVPATLDNWGEGTFRGCSALDDLTFNEGLATIGARAFLECTSLKSVTIPKSVTRIDTCAFGDWMWGYNYQSHHDEYGCGIEELTILGGDTPLTIGAGAFIACRGLSGKTITLPKRVSTIEGGAFLFISDAIFEIENPNITLAPGMVDYPDTLEFYEYATGFTSREDALIFSDEPREDEGLYNVSIPDPWADDDYIRVGKYLPSPNGSVVRYPNTLTRETSPTLWGYVKALEYDREVGYYEMDLRPTFEAVEMSGGEETPDDPVVDVAGAGRLEVTTKGTPGISANVCVFDDAGNLATSAQARSRYALITSLQPGTYTVVAFAKNGHFSTVGSLDGFADLGVDASQYVQKSVTIQQGKDTSIELTVPKMSAISTNLVQSSSVAISKQQTYKGQEFFATVNFRMAEGKAADTLKVKLPKGLAPTSVSSAKKNYGTGGYDATTQVITVALDAVDAQTGRVYVGLKATESGRHVVSASVVSGGTTVPVGDAATTVRALSLELPTAPVQGKSFAVGVYAAPNTEVTLKTAGKTQAVTTNKAGYARTTIDLADVETTLTYTIVSASVDDGGTTVSESGVVEFNAAHTERATLDDFTFIHAGKPYYIVRDGHAQPSSSYYVYVANGKETNKYWTFTATYTSSAPLQIGGDASAVIQNVYCTARVQMLDGSSRYQRLSLLSSKKQEDGNYLTTFAGTLYLEQAGDHVFPTELIPYAFDVALHLPDDEAAERTQADIDVLRDKMNISSMKWLVRAKERAVEGGVSFPADDEDAETAWENYGWDEDEGYSWVFFYNVREEPIWEYYKQELGEDSPEFVQLDSYVRQLQASIDLAATVFDAIYGIDAEATPEKSITSCGGAEEFFEGAIDYVSDVPYDASDLAKQGFTVTDDANAGTAPASAGTPTKGLSGDTYAVPASSATKVNKGDDGTVKSIEYRDSNGNSATIPVEKINNGIDLDWLKPNAADILNNAKPGNDVLSFLDSIDEQINSKLPPDELAKGGSKLGKAARAGGNVASATGVAISQYDKIKQSEELSNYYADAAAARGEVDNIEIHLNYLRMHGKVGTRCWKAWLNERDWAAIVANGKLADREWHLTELIRGECFDIYGATAGTMTGGVGNAAAYGVDKITGKAVADGMDANKRVLDPALQKLNAAHLKRIEDCEEDENNNDAPNHVPPILDPSGVVYEAFPGNLLEGVTATALEVEDGVATPWAAEEYGQENPQLTGAGGFFGWDVPVGSWQVRLEKDGYETVTTDTMEVPPPQSGLEIPMVVEAAPKVASVTADTSTIEIAFDQYMDADEGALADIAVKVGDTAVSASSLSWRDVEEATTGTFSKVLVVKTPAGTKAGDTLSVSVGGVKNYAGKTLATQHSESVKVAARPAKLVFNFEDTISLQVGTSRPTSVRVYDADDNPMEGVRLTASLDSDLFATVDDADAVTDEEGVAKLQLEALMPGMSELTVEVTGTVLHKSVNLLTTADDNRAARPTARFVDVATGETIAVIGEGSPAENAVYLNRPTNMYIESATEDARIYYTLDGSCPCQDTDGRVVLGADSLSWDGTTQADLIIAAYKNGMDYSERLFVNIRVGEGGLKRDISDATIAAIANQTYTGKALTPAPAVTVDGTTLAKDTDYTLSYKNNTKVGTATVTVTGKGGYAGSAEKTFKIVGKMSDATVATIAAQTYAGKALTPAPKVTFAGVALKSGTDYTLSYKNNVNAGTATVTIAGRGNYAGTTAATFKINPADISKATMAAIAAQGYLGSGKQVKPTPKLTFGGATLKSGTDFTLAYGNNAPRFAKKTQTQTATVTVTGRGNFKGTRSAKFTIKYIRPTWSGASRLPVRGTAAYAATNGGYVRVKSGTALRTSDAVLAISGRTVTAKKAGSSTLVLVDPFGTQVATRRVTVFAVHGRTYEFESSVDRSYVLDIEGGSKRDGAQMIVWRRNNGKNQRYVLYLQSDGTYAIKSVNSGRYLTVESKTGKFVQQWAWKGTKAQRWRLTVDPANRVTFVNVATGKCFDVQGGKTTNRAKMIVWRSNDGLNQKWKLNQK